MRRKLGGMSYPVAQHDKAASASRRHGPEPARRVIGFELPCCIRDSRYCNALCLTLATSLWLDWPSRTRDILVGIRLSD